MSSHVPHHSALDRDRGHRPVSETTGSGGRAPAAHVPGFSSVASGPAGSTRSSDPRRTLLLADVTDLEPHWLMAIDAATD